MATPIPSNRAPLTAWGVAAATGGTLVRAARGAEERVALGITSDSRSLTAGCAFVALRGTAHDGHDFAAEAVRHGAVLLVVEKGRAPEVANGVDIVEVDDTLVAWGDLARAHLHAWRRSRQDSCVFAITGSAGKTTTKELCAALLSPMGRCHASAGNLNNRVGVPAVAFAVEAQHRFAVFELGMSVQGEIATLAGIVEPDVGVLTNVGTAHAEGVGGTRADVAREKGALFAALGERGVAITCADDAAAMQQVARTRATRIRTFGLGAEADYRLVDRSEIGLDGSRVRIDRRKDGTEARVWLGLPGEAAALDLAAALAAAETVAPLGDDAIDAALRVCRPMPPGRQQVRRLADGTVVIDDTYNANPESVCAALRTLHEVAGGRRTVFVLGEMRELGPAAPREHAALGDAIAQSGVAFAISCGGLADLAVAGAAQRGVDGARTASVEEACRVAPAHVVAGDVVLVKASRSVGAERVVAALVCAHGGEAESP